MFFGYFASNRRDQSEKSIVNRIDFTVACIKKALIENAAKGVEKDIDLFLPLSSAEMAKVQAALKKSLTPEQYAKIGGMQYTKRTGDDNNSDAEVRLKERGGINVRFYNGFRLSNHSFKTMLKNADPLCGLTGDQSFVEGLLSGN